MAHKRFIHFTPEDLINIGIELHCLGDSLERDDEAAKHAAMDGEPDFQRQLEHQITLQTASLTPNGQACETLCVDDVLGLPFSDVCLPEALPISIL